MREAAGAGRERERAAGQPDDVAIADVHRGQRQPIVAVASALGSDQQNGRAPCRERECQYVEIWGVDGSLNKKTPYRILSANTSQRPYLQQNNIYITTSPETHPA